MSTTVNDFVVEGGSGHGPWTRSALPDGVPAKDFGTPDGVLEFSVRRPADHAPDRDQRLTITDEP